ncbi:MAG TPA: imidazole glycerol phosphate synthase subunit HisH [Fimbriimonadaceae bacterium]|nr:imidazole glycerol phosphate synthase subunit HisH [Fimbriimonadaceae bacterium]
MIAVVDYGAGNLHSVCNALDVIGRPYRIAQMPLDLDAASAILLPGVGHFGQMMRSLESTGMADRLREEAGKETPLLGICLGMQALFESSEEAPGIAGLGLLPGEIRRFVDVPRVPHMGWNDVEGAGIFYFANSFYAPVSECTTGVSEYGVRFSAIVRKGNVGGFQFHPEKSSAAGLDLLRKWCEAC